MFTPDNFTTMPHPDCLLSSFICILSICCSRCKTHKLGVEFVFKRAMFFDGPQVTIKAEQVKYVERSRPNVLLPKSKFKWKDAPFKVKIESYSFEMNPDFSDDDDEFDF